jgi:hypothetical protein
LLQEKPIQNKCLILAAVMYLRLKLEDESSLYTIASLDENSRLMTASLTHTLLEELQSSVQTPEFIYSELEYFAKRFDIVGSSDTAGVCATALLILALHLPFHDIERRSVQFLRMRNILPVNMQDETNLRLLQRLGSTVMSEWWGDRPKNLSPQHVALMCEDPVRIWQGLSDSFCCAAWRLQPGHYSDVFTSRLLHYCLSKTGAGICNVVNVLVCPEFDEGPVLRVNEHHQIDYNLPNMAILAMPNHHELLVSPDGGELIKTSSEIVPTDSMAFNYFKQAMRTQSTMARVCEMMQATGGSSLRASLMNTSSPHRTTDSVHVQPGNASEPVDLRQQSSAKDTYAAVAARAGAGSKPHNADTTKATTSQTQTNNQTHVQSQQSAESGSTPASAGAQAASGDGNTVSASQRQPDSGKAVKPSHGKDVRGASKDRGDRQQSTESGSAAAAAAAAAAGAHAASGDDDAVSASQRQPDSGKAVKPSRGKDARGASKDRGGRQQSTESSSAAAAAGAHAASGDGNAVSASRRQPDSGKAVKPSRGKGARGASKDRGDRQQSIESDSAAAGAHAASGDGNAVSASQRQPDSGKAVKPSRGANKHRGGRQQSTESGSAAAAGAHAASGEDNAVSASQCQPDSGKAAKPSRRKEAHGANKHGHRGGCHQSTESDSAAAAGTQAASDDGKAVSASQRQPDSGKAAKPSRGVNKHRGGRQQSIVSGSATAAGAQAASGDGSAVHASHQRQPDSSKASKPSGVRLQTSGCNDDSVVLRFLDSSCPTSSRPNNDTHSGSGAATHPLDRLSFVNLCLAIDERFASARTRRKLRRICVKASLLHSVDTVVCRLQKRECVFGMDCAISSRCSRAHSSMMTINNQNCDK